MRQTTIPLPVKKKRILCLFDFAAHTGFATVSKNIVDELCRHFGDKIEIVVVGINFFSEEGLQYNKQTFVLSALVTAPRIPGVKPDEFGRMSMMKILQEDPEGYDAVFIIQDTGIILPIVPILKDLILANKKKNNQKQPKFIFYAPVDCGLVRVLVDNIEFFDVPVAYTEYGKNVILGYKPELRGKIKVIPHGNNPKDFYPISKEDIAPFRKEYFGENADKFIITAVNRNQPRKDYPTTIFGFIEAKKNWKVTERPPFLYLHCNPEDPLGWNLRILMQQTDLVEYEDYMFPPKHLENHGATTELLCKIYNASDLFVTTNLGEGWGITNLEAMACKVPVIAPYHTSLIEISGQGTRMYPLYKFYPSCNTIDNMIRDQSDLYELADVILEAVDNKLAGTDTEMVEKAYKYVRSLDWKIVCKAWIDIFEKVLKI